MRRLPLTLALVSAAAAQTYTISTFAGGGLPVSIPGLNASLGPQGPQAVAADPSGDLYFAFENAILRLDATTGAVTLAAGSSAPGFGGDNGPASAALLNNPAGVAVDAANNLYIADSGNNRIRKVSGGTITTIAGTGAAGFSGDKGAATSAVLNNPTSVALDSSGNVFLFDANNSRVRKISGGNINTIGSGSNQGAIAVDSAGNVYFADSGNFLVQKITPAGVSSIAVARGTAGTPVAIAADPSGNIYLADPSHSIIWEVTNGNGALKAFAGNKYPGFSGDNGPALNASLDFPSGVAVDSSANVYIADTDNHRIREVSGGAIDTIAGNGTPGFSGDGGFAAAAQINPTGVALDSAGNVYIADTDNNRIRMVTPTGAISTIAGTGAPGYAGDGGPAAAARLTAPEGVAFDALGNLYIADTGNNAIREISGGIITTVAGNGLAGYSGDLGPAAAAELWNPVAIALDLLGNLYIADSANDVIREVTLGSIYTIAGGGPQFNDDGPATNAQLFFPGGIAVDFFGNLFIADTGDNCVREVTAGFIATVPGSTQFSDPYSIALDGAGNIYVADTGNGRVGQISGGNMITIAGGGKAFGDNGAATAAQLSAPQGLALSSTGLIYIGDWGSGRVRVLTPTAPGGVVSGAAEEPHPRPRRR